MASLGTIPPAKGGLTVVKHKTTMPKSQSSGGLSVFKDLNIKPRKTEDEQNAEDAEAYVNKDAFYLYEAERLVKIEQLLVSFKNKMAVAKLVALAKFYSLGSVEGQKIVDGMFVQVGGVVDSSKIDVNMRENALMLATDLLKAFGQGMEPYIVQMFPHLLFFHGDKSAAVRDMSSDICKIFINIANPQAFRLLYPHMKKAVGKSWEDGNDVDWRIKVGAMTTLQAYAPRVSKHISRLLPEMIPLLSTCIYDAKKQVQTAGVTCLTEVCKSISNDDIRPSVSQLVRVIAVPDEAAKTLDKLLETTFVVNVDAAVLALIAPLLGKVMKSRTTSLVKRKAAKVIDIMCRLVAEPADVAPFMPLLMPQLEKVIEEITDDDVVEVCKEARESLLKAVGDGHAAGNDSTVLDEKDLDLVQSKLLDTLLQAVPVSLHPGHTSVCKYIADITAMLVVFDTELNPLRLDYASQENGADLLWRAAVAMTHSSDWNSCVVPYLRCHTMTPDQDVTDKTEIESVNLKEAEKLSHAFREGALGEVPDNNKDDDDDGTDICNIEFSLAFGGKILLHNTRLKLGKGRRYGLMGKNGAGKTTLLTNIGTGNIEGMPPELRMMYVQHDDRTDDMGMPLVEELIKSDTMIEAGVTAEEASAALRKIHFTEHMLANPRSSLSGGWKMKLLIIKAMLYRADVLLLDEPTNHLDAASVQWLVDFILSNTEATCLIVSHDTPFMDKVLTDVIHYETRKLVYYHGNLTHFVHIHPEAQYYYEMQASTLKFNFPNPERLDGINSSTRAILKLDNASYTYPGSSKPTITNATVKVCLASRVAVLGANGAGKSTLIKMLVQETIPDDGSSQVWKHMNLRIAYVAQHSFHHIEEHVDTTPVDYMKWRFAGGVDREDMSKANTKLTVEEEQHQKDNLKYGDILSIEGRRKNGRTMEYECTFHGQTPRDLNKYIAIEILIERGYSKLVQQCDTKVAAMAAGLAVRPLLTKEIQGHLNEFNLDEEFGTFGTIKRLSGGQKVKLVLAAAMWNRPHLLVLDEPTNYLDREALGALSQAIKGFGGGVLIISHNKEFTDALCTETWIVEGGKCTVDGGAEEKELKLSSERATAKGLKKSISAPDGLDGAADSSKKDPTKSSGGNINKTIAGEIIMNPRSLEPLSKKEIRKLEKLAQVAGMSLKDYVGILTFKSPEWKFL